MNLYPDKNIFLKIGEWCVCVTLVIAEAEIKTPKFLNTCVL